MFKKPLNGSEHLDVYLGKQNMGIEVYVLESQYDEANAILNEAEIVYET